MIDFAQDEMIPELKRIWLRGFPEDTEYCGFYFENYFSPENCIVVSGNSGIETATYMFRGRCLANGKMYNAVYWYGCVTREECRRRGNLSCALEFLQGYCTKNCIDIIAVSSVDETFPLYESHGFSPGINVLRTRMKVSYLLFNDNVSVCGYEEFTKMRGAYLGDYSICWDDKTERYMYKDLCRDGGIVTVDIDGLCYYAAYTLYENELLIRETDCTTDIVRRLIYDVCRYLGYTGAVTLYTRLNDKPEFDEIILSEPMYYAHIWINPSSELSGKKAPWYINLTAD